MFASGEAYLKFCREFIEAGGLTLKSPWTGDEARTTQSIVYPSQPWKVCRYAYRFDFLEPLYVIISGFGDCRVSGVLFPLRNVFFSFSSSDEQNANLFEEIRYFREYVVRYYDIFANSYGFGRLGFLLQSSHFAHSIWNELSAVDGLVDLIPRSAVVHIAHEPVGAIDELFPELVDSRIARYPNMPIEQFLISAQAEGQLFVPIGRTHIPQSLLSRIHDVARRRFPSDVDFSIKIRSENDLVLWATLREEGRIWKNQADILCDIINQLAGSSYRIAVIFDGFTPGYRQSAGHAELQREREILKQIVSATSSEVHFISLIGAQLQQAFVWGSIADFYIAHHGTIQHKIGWLHDLPGIAHRAVTPGFHPSRMLALRAASDNRLPHYVYGRPIDHEVRPGDARNDLVSYTLSTADISENLFSFARKFIQTNKNPATARDKGKILHEITPDFYTKNSAKRLVDDASKAWTEQRWEDALDLFCSAVKASPKYRNGYEQLLRFLLMTYSSWFGADRQVGRVISLIFVSYIDPKSRWAAEQLHASLIKIGDEDLRGAVKAVLSALENLQSKQTG
jgi:hypothetical protein